MWFWIDWNRRCSAVADVSLYLEDLNEVPALELLAETVGVDIDMEKALAVSKRTNSKGSTEISERWIRELVGSDHFGYFS